MRPALVKNGIARTLQLTRADRVVGRLSGTSHEPFIVGYHRVVEDFPAHAARSIPPMLISREMFERHLDWIGQRFRWVTLDELGSRLAAGGTFDEPVAAVTFDDGYRDVYDHAFPILKRKGIPAAVFVVTDFVESSRPLIHDVLYLLLTRAWATLEPPATDLGELLVGLGVEPAGHAARGRVPTQPFAATRFLLTLPQAEIRRVTEALEARVGLDHDALEALRPLSWDVLAEMQEAGITIGSHTSTHPVLPHEVGPRVLDEASESRLVLERRCARRIGHFAYPDGAFDTDVVRAVAAAGYRLAYTTCGHRDPDYPLLTIPRRLLWERSCSDAVGRFSPAIMSCQANGVFDLVNGCRRRHRATATTSLSPADTDAQR